MIVLAKGNKKKIKPKIIAKKEINFMEAKFYKYVRENTKDRRSKDPEEKEAKRKEKLQQPRVIGAGANA